jgi:hypothetical protein
MDDEKKLQFKAFEIKDECDILTPF